MLAEVRADGGRGDSTWYQLPLGAASECPDELPDAGVPLFGSPIWARMTASERDRLRHHFQAWQLSQYMHGEQGALMAAAFGGEPGMWAGDVSTAEGQARRAVIEAIDTAR